MRPRLDLRRVDISFAMILQPKSLVDSAISGIAWVSDIEFDQEFAVLKARWIKGDGVVKSDPYKTPFSGMCRAELVSDEEELVGALYDGCHKRRDRWNRWWRDSAGRRRWPVVKDSRPLDRVNRRAQVNGFFARPLIRAHLHVQFGE